MDLPAIESCPLLEHHLTESFEPCKFAKGNCTVFQTTTNCVALLIGLGVLSSPYAIATGGWASLFLNFFFALIYYYTTYLLTRCLEAHPELADYLDVSTKAFGRRGRLIATTLLFSDLLSALVGYGISLSDNLVHVFPSSRIGFPGLHGRRFLMFVATLLLLPTLWVRSFRSLSLISASSIISSVLVLLTLMWISSVDGIGIDHSIPLVHLDGLPLASGLYLFTYGANFILPSVRTSMKDRTKFPKVLAFSFGIAATFYGGLGVLGASMFGADTRSQITLNMPAGLIASKVALWANIINPMTRFTLLLRPIATELEGLFPWPRHSSIHISMSITLRSVLVIALILVALSLPFFGYMVSLVGSSITVTMCLILPCWFYWKIFHSSLGRWEMASFIFLTLLGLGVGIVGTVSSIMGLEASTSHAPMKFSPFSNARGDSPHNRNLYPWSFL